MSGYWNSVLSYKYFTALLALCAIGKTCCRTSCRFTVDNLGLCVSTIDYSGCTADVAISIEGVVVCVTNLIYRLLSHDGNIANRAMLAFGETSGSAGWSFRCVCCLCMTYRIYAAHFFLATIANAFLYTSSNAGRFVNDSPRTIIMLMPAAENNRYRNNSDHNTCNHTTDNKRKFWHGSFGSGTF